MISIINLTPVKQDEGSPKLEKRGGTKTEVKMKPNNSSTRIIRAKVLYSRCLYMHVAWLLATASLLQTGVASAAPPAGTVFEKRHKSAIGSQVPAIADALRLRASSVEEEISVHDAQTSLLYDNSTTISSEKSSDNHLRAPPSTPIQEPGIWPCMDELDKKLIKISLPVIASFAVPPVVQALDLIFINRLGNALAVAGQAAANQMYGSVFWLTSFIPSITAIQVSKQVAQGNQDGVQEAVCRAIVVGVLFASIGSAGMLLYPERALGSVMKKDAPAFQFAKPYLKLRSLSFLPSVISTVGFSAFRGQLDTTTPVRISLISNLAHAVLVPVFIFTCAMGVSGAALASLVADLVSAGIYIALMAKRHMIHMSKLLKVPDLGKVLELLKGGLALQLRMFAFNLTFIMVTRITQSLDSTGVAAAAHSLALQTFQVGGIVLLALSVVAQTVVPGALVETYDASQKKMVGGPAHARSTVSRLMMWGFILGTTLGALQFLVTPFMLKASPLAEVREAARVPAILSSIYQVINGLVFIGEGVMVGCGNFMQLSLSTAAAAVGCIATIKTLAPKFGLTGVWLGFGVFNFIRLLCVWLHMSYTGPLASVKRGNAKDTGRLQ